MVSHEVASKIKSPEKRFAKTEIPKSTEIYRGDINDAVIAVQQITGFEITPEWWVNEVGNEGPTEDILKRFDTAFEKFVHSETGIDSSEAGDDIKVHVTPAEIVAEAELELAGFDKSTSGAEEAPELRSEFIDALTSHLKEKYFGVDDSLPESKILKSGSEQYREAERLRSDTEDPDTRIVESHFVNSDGLEITVLGTSHTFDPEDPEVKYLDTLVREKADNPKTVLILEGQYAKDEGLPPDPSEAVKLGGGEFNYVAALADQLGVEYTPAEPDAHDNAVNILAESPNLSPTEVALHYGVKTLSFLFKDQPTMQVEDVAPYLYHSVGVVGDETEGGIVVKRISRQEVLDISEQEKAEIIKEMPEVVARLNEAFSRLYPGEKLLELTPGGEVTLLYDLSKPPVLWDPSSEDTMGNPTVIAEISQLDMLMRDRHTFRLVMRALDQGLEPVVAVGSSHVSTLAPALNSAFTPQ